VTSLTQRGYKFDAMRQKLECPIYSLSVDDFRKSVPADQQTALWQ
jgi:hypothetical protein